MRRLWLRCAPPNPRLSFVVMHKTEMEDSEKNRNINANRVLLAAAIVFLSFTVVPFIAEEFMGVGSFHMNIRFYIGAIGIVAVFADRVYVKYARSKGENNA